MYSDLQCLGSANLYLDEINELIDNISLFDGLNREEVFALCHFMTCYAAPSNYTLLKECQSGDYLLLVLTGEIAVMKSAYGADSRCIAKVERGGSIGEMSLLDGDPRFASCITLKPTDFAVLTRAGLNVIMSQMPKIANKLLLVLLQLTIARLRDTSNSFLPKVSVKPHV